jgi:hypothetical protein
LNAHSACLYVDWQIIAAQAMPQSFIPLCLINRMSLTVTRDLV